MEAPRPSVQSFYQREVLAGKGVADASPVKPGDGFTEGELSDALDPLSRQWNPAREYEELGIAQLVPGPHAVTFVGRVVNLGTFLGISPKQPKATGFHSLIVKDDLAAISIKLYFAHHPYPLQLGQLLSLWTVFISNQSKTSPPALPCVAVSANMFPGRVTSDHVLLHTTPSTDGVCHAPLGYRRGHALPGLMTLDSWLQGGHDGVAGARILVCVQSIGARKTIQRRDGTESALAEVGIFDHTGACRMTLWAGQVASAEPWQPGRTILLITGPGYKAQPSGRGSVSILHATMLDVEPDFPDAAWLRRYATARTKRESLKAEFPEGVWDVESAETGVVRMLFTLAELDRWVRSDGDQTFTGFLNVTIMDISLVTLHRRNMLMCSECCGVPIYANSPVTPCRNCSKPVPLSLNPGILGTLLDETGSVAAGKLLWSPRAWEQLFGRSIEAISMMSDDEVRLFEQRVLWMRCHLVVGWAGEEVTGGRLAVLGMGM
ncbi:hypothetical protein B2J93_5283 [Marssonina coronariae]|uniref:Nucleic acid-binding protein n=1 Tax=Diplocarpon coronariae TaxID=2795749 RepID=A0A218YTE6_9HELO|nr:hypothetical protein B2J93_5283 [Marssonina coronariae]